MGVIIQWLQYYIHHIAINYLCTSPPSAALRMESRSRLRGLTSMSDFLEVSEQVRTADRVGAPRL
jgi:hypothetical protein